MQPVILVSFFRDACPHCRSFKPVLDALMQQGVQILRVDASHDRVSAHQWGVQGVPCTFICRPEGQGLRVLGRVEGAVPLDSMVNTIRATAADDVGQLRPSLHQQPQVFLSEPPRPDFNGLPSTTPRPRRP